MSKTEFASYKDLKNYLNTPEAKHLNITNYEELQNYALTNLNIKIIKPNGILLKTDIHGRTKKVTKDELNNYLNVSLNK